MDRVERGRSFVDILRGIAARASEVSGSSGCHLRRHLSACSPRSKSERSEWIEWMQGWKSREVIEANTPRGRDEKENLREKNHAETRCDDCCLNASTIAGTGWFCAPTLSYCVNAYHQGFQGNRMSTTRNPRENRLQDHRFCLQRQLYGQAYTLMVFPNLFQALNFRCHLGSPAPTM